MIVFRVQTVDGIGPYTPSKLPERVNTLLDDMWWSHGNPVTHPRPQQDFPSYSIMPDEVCAFISHDSLLRWFDGFEELLDECGFLVYEYDVPEYAVEILNHQVVVDRSYLQEGTSYTLV